jgi:hypothetical protein
LTEPFRDLEATIAALWRDAQPRVLERVEVVEAALAALRAGGLDEELADEARREAHKLAGRSARSGCRAGRTWRGRSSAGSRAGSAPTTRSR